MYFSKVFRPTEFFLIHSFSFKVTTRLLNTFVDLVRESVNNSLDHVHWNLVDNVSDFTFEFINSVDFTLKLEGVLNVRPEKVITRIQVRRVCRPNEFRVRISSCDDFGKVRVKNSKRIKRAMIKLQMMMVDP